MRIKQWHVGVAAEAFVAALFARYEYDVSVQYGANQPEYDLMVTKDDMIMKVSVKGSQDGSWGLTQSYKKGRTYADAINMWLSRHGQKTIICLVQLENVLLDELPRVYIATPKEIANHMKKERAGNGDTILYEYHEWRRGIAQGETDRIPEKWLFSPDRIEQLFQLIN